MKNRMRMPGCKASFQVTPCILSVHSINPTRSEILNTSVMRFSSSCQFRQLDSLDVKRTSGSQSLHVSRQTPLALNRFQYGRNSAAYPGRANSSGSLTSVFLMYCKALKASSWRPLSIKIASVRFPPAIY
jgi:hypothetical protein